MGRNYSRKSDPKVSDLSMIWDAENSDWRLSTFNDIFTLLTSSCSNNMYEPDSQYDAPIAGATVAITVNTNDNHLILTPAGTLATLTIELPAPTNLRDKQLLIVTSTNELTALTVDGNGATVIGAPTTLAAEGFFTLKYDIVLSTWYRVG